MSAENAGDFSSAERFELDYIQRPGRLRPRRWRMTLGIAMLTLLLFTAAHLWSGHAIYQAGPVAEVHALFGHDCSQCHDLKWRTGLRLFAGDTVRSVSDTACQRCHAEPAHNAKEATHPSCASCHREHTHAGSLVRVADGHCISCHGSLDKHLVEGASTRFEPRVTAFAEDHPEFELWRMEGYKDPGLIRFNHAVHLVEEGVLTLARDGAERVRKRLDCQACHTTDAAGRTMQPIRYEKHCQECHPLSVQVAGAPREPKLQKLAAAFNAEPVPHQPPIVVRALLRERLIKLFASQEKEALPIEPAVEAPAVPGQRRTPAVTKAQFEWVHSQLREMERVLFNLDGGCRYCHTLEPERVDGLPVVRAARINEREWPRLGISQRWLPHSKFSHEPHRFLDCRECHVHASVSRETSDVLMPRLAQCQGCHQPAKQVRSDCVLCHAYHPASARPLFRGSMRTEACVPGEPALRSRAKEPLALVKP